MSVVGLVVLPSGVGFLPEDPVQREEARGQGKVAQEQSAQVSLLGGLGLVARKRPNLGLGEEKIPKNFPRYQNTPHGNPRVRKMVEGRSGLEMTRQRRKVRS
jgi:hypothetical protein